MRSELARLEQAFMDFVAADAKAKEVALAETRQVKIRQEIETKFGYYAEVRRHATGILQAADVSIVRQETVNTATESLMLSAPRYWLAPALVALGSGPGLLQEKKVKMAMVLTGRNRHYKWTELQRRHFESTAKACGIEAAGRAIIDDVIASTPKVIGRIAAELPAGFPEWSQSPYWMGLRAPRGGLEVKTNEARA